MVDGTLLLLPLPESRHKRTKLLYGIQLRETVYFICKKLENIYFSFLYVQNRQNTKCGNVRCECQVAKIADIFPKCQSFLPPDIKV